MKKTILTIATGFALAIAAQAENQVIYDDSLENGWQDYSWATVHCDNTSPVQSGSYSISVMDPTAIGYEAFWVHNDTPFNPSSYQSLTFWVYPTEAATDQIMVNATEGMMVLGSGYGLTFTPAQVNTWVQVTIPLSAPALGLAGITDFDGIQLKNYTGAPQTFYLDTISLVGASGAPGTVQLAVTPATVLRTIDPRFYGVNACVADGNLGTPATATALAAMQTQVMGFPDGSDSDNYDWQSNEDINGGGSQWASSVATFATTAEAAGAQAFLAVNYGQGTPEQAAAWVAYYNGSPNNNNKIGNGQPDAFGRNWQTVGYWASIRAAAPLATDDGYNFLRIAHPAPFGFKYWVVGDEVYGYWSNDEHGALPNFPNFSGSPHDPDTYAGYFPGFAAEMKAVDSTIKVGMAGCPTYTYTGEDYGDWTTTVLTDLNALMNPVLPDFITDHLYPQVPGSENDASLLQNRGQTIGGDAQNIRQIVTDTVGGAAGEKIELDLTELNSVQYLPTGKQTVSLVNGLFMADAIGQLANSEFNACLWWNLRNGTYYNGDNSASLYGWRQFGDYGILASGDDSIYQTPLNTPYPTFFAAELLTHWGRGGDQVVSATTSNPLLSIYAAQLANGSLALLVINKDSADTLNAQIALNGFLPASGTATYYSYGVDNDTAAETVAATLSTPLNSGTFNDTLSNGAFPYSFPAYSMTVLVIPGTPGPSISSICPSAAVANQTITVTGNNFINGSTTATFTGAPAPVSATWVNSTTIQFTVPAAATTGPLTVNTPAGQATTPFTVVNAAPVISSFTPTVDAGEGTTVTITGQNFVQNQTTVSFQSPTGPAQATVLSMSCDGTQIIVNAPCQVSTGPITVNNGIGTTPSASPFTVNWWIQYYAPGLRGNGSAQKPDMSYYSYTPNTCYQGWQALWDQTYGKLKGIPWFSASITPPVGWTNTLNPTNLLVTFDGIPGELVTNAGGQVSVVVPVAYTNGPIVCYAPTNDVDLPTSFDFQYAFYSIAPASGAPGATVVITDANLTGVTAVAFNGIPATFVSNAVNQITATVPVAATTGPITVNTTNGILLSTLNFTVLPPVTNLVIYNDSLLNGFQDYSWATVNDGNTNLVYSGGDSISVSAQQWQALWTYHAPFSTAPYASLSFWINGGQTGAAGVELAGVVNSGIAGGYDLPTLRSNTWTEFNIPLSAMGVAGITNCEGFWFYATGAGATSFDVDAIQLNTSAAPSLAPVATKPKSGGFVTTLAGYSGQTYWIETSTNLLKWTVVSTNTLSAASLSVTNAVFPNSNRQFWRAVQP